MDYYNFLQNTNPLTAYNLYESNRTMQANTPWPLNFQEKSIQYNLNNAISMIKDSVQSERDDETFYDFLIAVSPNDDAKKIIESIRDDERIHNKIFRKLFTELTGVVLSPVNEVHEPKPNITYVEGIEKALFGELKAIEKYREIMSYMPNTNLYNMVMYILTDEIKHANKYNYLIATYFNK